MASRISHSTSAGAISLAKATLGWAPAVNLTEGLARTVEWVKANLRLFKDALHV